MEMLRTTDTSASPSNADRGPDSLSSDQEAALRAAFEHGYYKTPREVNVSELADHLDVPRSTLTYRLRRAEEQVMAAYIDHDLSYGNQSPAL